MSVDERNLSLAIQLGKAAAHLLRAYPMFDANMDVYAAAIRDSLGTVVETFGETLMDEASNRPDDEDVFYDFGDEPMTLQEALEKLPNFLGFCMDMLTALRQRQQTTFPYAAMGVRATTFGLLLQHTEPS